MSRENRGRVLYDEMSEKVRAILRELAPIDVELAELRKQRILLEDRKTDLDAAMEKDMTGNAYIFQAEILKLDQEIEVVEKKMLDLWNQGEVLRLQRSQFERLAKDDGLGVPEDKRNN